MAVVGEQLLQPESGMQRIDDTDSKIIYNGNWNTVSSSPAYYYNNTLHNTTDTNSNITFYFKGTKLNIISAYNTNMSNNVNIRIDGIAESFSVKKGLLYKALAYSKTDLENKIHQVEIETIGGNFILDAIDIDEDGYMCTEDEYLLQEGKADFPVKVADDSVVTEADVLSYASTLVNGEKQLLVSEKLKKIYVTDGQGGMTELSSSSSGSGVEIDDTTPSFSKVYSSKQTQTLIDNVVNNTLDKDTYASKENKGAVKYADNLSATLKASPLQYYGTDSNNKLGMHYFPIDTKDNTGLQQRVCLDIKANDQITIDSTLDISDTKVLVEAYKFIKADKDVKTTKTFDNTEKDNFFYDEENIEFTDSMHIKTEHDMPLTLNADGFYESAVIDINEYLELTLSEVNN